MTNFEAPSIEYGPLAPLFIVFGVALAGVLVEAFVPRGRRYLVQTVLAAGSAWWLHSWPPCSSRPTPPSVRTARPAGRSSPRAPSRSTGRRCFMWGVILILSLVSVMLFAERHLDGGLTAFAGQAAALPGTEAEREASTRGLEHTEVYPLMLFSIGGMMLFPASNDLLTMFVALEVLSLPLYLLCGLARRRRLLSQEAALKYFLLGSFSSAFFLYGVALVYGYAGSTNLAGDRRVDLRPARLRGAAARRHRADGGRPAVQGRARRRSTRGRPTSTKVLRPRSPGSWRPAPRSPPSARCSGCSTSRSALPSGTGRR